MSTATYKWDSISAEKDYISDARLSYFDIARRYGVTKKTVGELASKRKWTQRRREVYENGINSFEKKQAQLISQVNEKHLTEYRDIQNVGNKLMERLSSALDAGENIEPSELSAAIRAITVGIKGEREVMGATPKYANVLQGVESSESICDLTSAIERAEEMLREAGEL